MMQLTPYLQNEELCIAVSPLSTKVIKYHSFHGYLGVRSVAVRIHLQTYTACLHTQKCAHSMPCNTNYSENSTVNIELNFSVI